MAKTKDISIVIPAHNERESIEILVKSLREVLQSMGKTDSSQIVLVDDGSTDGTAEIIRSLAKGSDDITAVLFRKNFGKSAALMAGFQEAKGKVVLTMDADLQDDPQEIPRLLEKLGEGFDLVSGWKSNRKDPVEKRFASKIFNYVISRVSGVRIHDFNCGFKAYKSWCVSALQLRGNQYRFIPAIVAWQGGKVTEIPVLHHPRRYGRSKYGLRRYFHGAFDLFTLLLMTKFSQNPLYFFGIIGLPFFALGAGTGMYLLFNHIIHLISPELGFEMNTRPLLVISFSLMLIGLQVFVVGLLAEFVLRSSTMGPGFTLRETISGKDSEKHS